MPSIVYNQHEVRHTPAVHPTSPGNKNTHINTTEVSKSSASERKQKRRGTEIDEWCALTPHESCSSSGVCCFWEVLLALLLAYCCLEGSYSAGNP